MDGCPIVAFGSDAARQGMDVKASFEAGIKEHLEILGRFIAKANGEQPDGKAMAILSTMVGALTLSRVVNDPDLAQAFLDAATGRASWPVARDGGSAPRAGLRLGSLPDYPSAAPVPTAATGESALADRFASKRRIAKAFFGAKPS
jgi:hypothetical protein